MAKIAFGALISAIRGKVGTAVFTKGHSGPTARIRLRGTNPKTTAQTGVRSNMSLASKAAKGLSTTNKASWVSWAAAITKHNPVSGVAYNPAWIDAFTALASKFLQITPGGTIPVTPPASTYAGDTITVTPTGAAGKITFTPSAANTAGSKTELLVQKLKSANRKPNAKGYRTKTFTAFPGGTPVDVTGLAAGSYVAATRFVQTADGQVVPMLTSAVLTVT